MDISAAGTAGSLGRVVVPSDAELLGRGALVVELGPGSTMRGWAVGVVVKNWEVAEAVGAVLHENRDGGGDSAAQPAARIVACSATEWSHG